MFTFQRRSDVRERGKYVNPMSDSGEEVFIFDRLSWKCTMEKYTMAPGSRISYSAGRIKNPAYDEFSRNRCFVFHNHIYGGPASQRES